MGCRQFSAARADGSACAADGSSSDEDSDTAEVTDGVQSDSDDDFTMGPQAQLRRIARGLHVESAKLRRTLRAAECAARTSLAFYGEPEPLGCVLGALQSLLVHFARFAERLAEVSGAASETQVRERARLVAELYRPRTRSILPDGDCEDGGLLDLGD